MFFFAKFVDDIHVDLSLVAEVWLVADQEEDGVLLGVCFDLIHPELADVIEALTVGDVEDQEDALAAAVVGAGDCSETLLARGVPYLKFYVFALHFYRFESEVHPDGCQVVLGKLVFDEAHQDGGLSHPGIADDDCLVEVVELFYHADYQN